MRIGLLLGCLVMLWACGGEGPIREAVDGSNAAWDGLRERFTEEYFEHHPVIAVNQGRHQFDGRLPDWTPEGFERLTDMLHRYYEEAEAFVPEELDETRRLEREYLMAVADGELFWIEEARAPYLNPFYYQHWALDTLDPSPYVTRDYAPLAQRMEAYIAHMEALPAAAEQIRANLEKPIARPLAVMAQGSYEGLAGFLLDDAPGVFAEVTDGSMRQRFISANRDAASALKDLAAWFGEAAEEEGGDFKLGAEKFSSMVRRTEGLDIDIERLKKIGEDDMARNQAALGEACEELAPGKPIADCIAIVQNDKPDAGSIEAARGQLTTLQAFVRDEGVATIPSNEQAVVEETPPHMRWNFAFIDIPGPFEKELPSRYFISPPDPSWSAERQAAYVPGEADLLFTSVHEVWPGHFLQNLHAKGSTSPFGRVFTSYAFSEGWAHYAEEMMWEAGLGDGDPKVRIGMLLNALMRNARYLSAIGLHTGAMTLEDSQRLFVEQAYQDEGTAEQQARRGTFDPAYLNYTLGKLMLRKLRDDWTATNGGREAWGRFHDQVLSHGAPPVPLLRKALMGDGAGPAL